MPHRILMLLPLLLLLTACRSEPAALPVPLPDVTPEPGPLTGLTIVVDPGHGGYDGGARCVDSGRWEKQLNLQIALALRSCLTELGAQVVMTRENDSDLCDAAPAPAKTKKRQDMERRIALAREHKADLLLSVHMNEYRLRNQSGPQVFYREGHADSRLLAGCIQASLIEALQPPKERQAMSGDYFILQLDIPSVLVECGFISNAREERLLLDETYQVRAAQAIAEGVTDFLRLRGQ